MSVDMHVTKYVKIVEELRKEIAELKVKLRDRPKEVEVAVTEPCSCSKSNEVFLPGPGSELSPASQNLCFQVRQVRIEI